MEDPVLCKVQPGLFNAKPEFGVFVNARYKKGISLNNVKVRDGIVGNAADVVEYATNLDRTTKDGTNSCTRAILAFNPNQWSEWFEDDPKLQGLKRREGNQLVNASEKFLDTGGDLYFVLKSEVKDDMDNALKYLKSKMSKYCDDFDITESNTSSKRIINSLFMDGVANPCDPESFKTYVVKNQGSSVGYPGSAYLVTQKFKFNWTILGNMRTLQKEEMVGRRCGTDAMLPQHNLRAHIKRAHVVHKVSPINALARHPRMFRSSLPYGDIENHPGREEGLVYLQFSNNVNAINTILKNISGNTDDARPGDSTVDMLISAVEPLQGSFWYVPSVEELKLSNLQSDRSIEILDFWNLRSPNNEYMFYNQKEYLHRMSIGQYSPGDPPSGRVLRLLDFAFQQWNDQWFERLDMPKIPHLFDSIKSSTKLENIKKASVMIRKGWSIKVCLGRLFTTNKKSKLESNSFFGRRADFFGIHPDEIIVGRMPSCFSLGLGQAAMPYLREEEKMPAFVKGLSEAAGMGHVIPDYQILLQKGLGNMKNEMQKLMGKTSEENEFLQACILTIKGLQKYMRNHAFLARYLVENRVKFGISDPQCEGLNQITTRMTKISKDPPETFVEAVQLLYSFHCCLHLIGEPTSIGRLDQLLQPFLPGTSDKDAQEAIDCLFVKLCENVHVNSSLLNDLQAWGMCAVPYTSTGLFANGDTINQWVQQITVGGYKATEETVREDGCNEVTMMCLKASRRLPLNAPCLSLRMNKDTPLQVLQEASKAILSGGAHPILINDERIIQSLLGTRDVTPDNPIALKTTLNYACDGCYEPLFPGENDFSLSYVPLLKVLEMSINQGLTFLNAGPRYLEGSPQSLSTELAENIDSFDKLLDIFQLHLKVRTEYNVFLLLSNYGNIAEFCPSPLLSTLFRGCLETKRDIYNGGANYTLVGVQFISFSNTVDALYAIKRLCFDGDSAVVSLSDLVTCLKCDWGYHMQEPFQSEGGGATRGEMKSYSYKELRERALRLPKFGTSEGSKNKDLQSISRWLADKVSKVVNEVAYAAPDGQPLKDLISSLKKKYSVPGAPWDVILATGSGTFEGYVGWGAQCAASADGRRASSPIASDLSAVPAPLDKPVIARSFDIYESLKSWDMESINLGFPDGAEVDLNIDESFKEDDLVAVLKNYAKGQDIGGNILTITCASPSTYANAQGNPEQYDLVRVRTGGWSEFFVAFFREHQKHHERRIYYHAPTEKPLQQQENPHK